MSTIAIKKIGITRLDVDAIVNAANEGLWEGGGVCGAIFSEAGSAQLTKACQAIGGCDTGNAVITPAFNLSAKYIIHAVGPVWRGGGNKEPQLLYSAYKQSLKLAKENGCHSIAFPLISAGIFGYPKDKAWKKALRACNDFIADNPNYEMEIIFAVLDEAIQELGQGIRDSMKTGKTGVDSAIAKTEAAPIKINVATAKSDTDHTYSDYKTSIKPGKYRHYKGGEYEVIEVAHHSETEEAMVVYRALYGEKELWVRPAKMWDELVEVDGKKVRRFEYIGG